MADGGMMVTMDETEIRARIMEGRAPVEVFARAIDKTPQTVAKYIGAGMPADYFGKTPFVIVEPAIAWLRNRRRKSSCPA